MSKYLKALVAVVVAGLVAVQTAIGDGAFSDDDWKAIGTALLTAVLVYLVPNKPAE
jgi:hypothetical protein